MATKNIFGISLENIVAAIKGSPEENFSADIDFLGVTAKVIVSISRPKPRPVGRPRKTGLTETRTTTLLLMVVPPHDGSVRILWYDENTNQALTPFCILVGLDKRKLEDAADMLHELFARELADWTQQGIKPKPVRMVPSRW